MEVRVVRYIPTARERVQAFVDLGIGPYRINGVHLERAGTLRSAQLTPTMRGLIRFIPSIEFLDRNLEDHLTKVILQAIHEHIETLPQEQRALPPRPARKPDEQPAAPVSVKPAPQPAPDLARWNLLFRLISQAGGNETRSRGKREAAWRETESASATQATWRTFRGGRDDPG